MRLLKTCGGDGSLFEEGVLVRHFLTFANDGDAHSKSCDDLIREEGG